MTEMIVTTLPFFGCFPLVVRMYIPTPVSISAWLSFLYAMIRYVTSRFSSRRIFSTDGIAVLTPTSLKNGLTSPCEVTYAIAYQP